MKDRYCYIEFEFNSLERLSSLQKMFWKLKEVKEKSADDINLEEKQDNLSYVDPVDDYQWKNYLDNRAIAWFQDTFDFNSEEGIVYWKLLELTEPENRLEHPFFKTPGNWDFESMLDSILNGYYLLIDLVKEKDNQGCLYYQPTAYPFGGSDSLVELIRAFGNKITYNSRHKYIKPTIESQWDYELAKQLVKQGIGFTPDVLQNKHNL